MDPREPVAPGPSPDARSGAAGADADVVVARAGEVPRQRMPDSVLRRRPAEVLPPPGRLPPPAVGPARRPVRGRPLPAPRPARGRPLAAPGPARGRPLPAPRPARGRRTLPIGWIAAALVFIGLFCVGMGLGNATGFDVTGWFRGPDEPPPREFPVLDPSRPVRLTIPAIKVEAPVRAVGLADDGSVDVPPLNRHDETGWFDRGPTPGQFGPALIVGHADTRTGPSVFHHLRTMKPGQRIEVLRDDRSTAIFEVNSVENFGKEKLPVKRVYADYSRPSLRLVTCGGTWLGEGRGYSDNIVVFASLVEGREP